MGNAYTLAFMTLSELIDELADLRHDHDYFEWMFDIDAAIACEYAIADVLVEIGNRSYVPAVGINAAIILTN